MKSIREEAAAKFKEKNYEDALKKYEESLQVEVKSSQEKIDINNNIALCHIKLGGFRRALTHTDCVLNIEPTNQKALYRRAIAAEQLGELQVAAEAAQRLVSLGNKEILPIYRQILQKAKTNIQEINGRSNRAVHAEKITAAAQYMCISLKVDQLEFLQSTLTLELPEDFAAEATQYIEGAIKGAEGLRRLLVKGECKQKDVLTLNWSSAAVTLLAAHTHFSKNKWASDLGPSLWSLSLSLWQLLCCVVTTADAIEDDDDTERLRLRRKKLLQLDVPTDRDPEVIAAQKRITQDFPTRLLSWILKSYVRQGLVQVPDFAPKDSSERGTSSKSLDNTEAPNKTEALMRSKSAILVCELIRYTGSLAEADILEALTMCINNSFACRRCASAALRTVGALGDERRRLGSRVQALNKTQALMTLLESILQLLDDNEALADNAAFALTSIFTLLADKDRAPTNQVSVDEIASDLLGPYMKTTDVSLLETGLRGLQLVWLADRDAVKGLMLENNSISFLIDLVKSPCFEAPAVPDLAANLLVRAMEFPELRTVVMTDENLSSLSQSLADFKDQKWTLKTPALPVKIAAVLARLCIHCPEARETLFRKHDFAKEALVAMAMISKVGPRTAAAKSAAENSSLKTMVQSFLEVLFFLTIHGAFKSQLLALLNSEMASNRISTASEETDATDDQQIFSIATALRFVGDIISPSQDTVSGFMLANIYLNLFKSREDKDRISRKKRPGQPGPDLDPDQLDALEEFFDKLPEHSKPLPNGIYDRGSQAETDALITSLTKTGAVKILCNLCTANKAPTPNLLAAVASALGKIVKKHELAGRAAADGAITALLIIADGLRTAGPLYDEELAQCRQALCHICLHVPVDLLSYREALDVTGQLLPLLENSYELYQFEACLALTNLTALREEVRERVYHAKGWQLLMDVAVSDNSQCRAAALEAMCNMALSNSLQDKLATAPNPTNFELLLAFSSERENPRGQSAATGCLAILTSDLRLAVPLTSIRNFYKLREELEDLTHLQQNPGLLQRILTIANHIAAAVLWNPSQDQNSSVPLLEFTPAQREAATDLAAAAVKAAGALDSTVLNGVDMSSTVNLVKCYLEPNSTDKHARS